MLKILHISLSGQYIDGWGYQENMLPYYLSLEGTENVVIASANTFPSYVSEEKRAEILSKGNDYEFEGVRIIRIPSVSLTTSLAFAPRLYETICKIKPDVIFHHDIVFSTLAAVRRYCRHNKVALFVDNHADELNMSRNRCWNFLFHSVANRSSCKKLLGVAGRFYGVTPARCDFMKKYYAVPPELISLLPIGADSIMANHISSKIELRHKYGFSENERIIVSGGKMGADKGTDRLISAVENSGVHLVLFGKFVDDETEMMARQSSAVSLFGWCDRQKTLELLKLADLACWPVHHTTLIEDAVSVGTPIMVRKSGNVSHLMIGNGLWTDISSLKEDIARFFLMDKDEIAHRVDEARGIIDYRNIAKNVINDIRQICQ